MLSPGTISAFQGRIQTRYTNKTLPQSIKKEDHADSFNELSGYLLQLLPDGILTGLTLSLSGSNVLIEAGTWMIDSFIYSIISQQSLPIDAQDVTDSRYDVLYADDTGNVHLISGALSLTPLEPSIPNGTIKLGSILITPTVITITPPPLTGYVDTTTNQDVHGLKNFMDGVQSVTRPLGDSTLWAATTRWVQNELADYTILPSLTGNTGKVLGTDGTNVMWVTGGGGGGGGTWGSIVGTLSNQTDLQNALNGKQDTLVSGTNIKTINGASLLGSTDILLQTPIGYTPENVSNKAVDFTTINNTLYPTTQAVFNFVELVNTILTGLVTTTAGTTATTTAGTYRVNNTVYSIGTSTNTTIPAQDATLSRYSILYGTTSSAIGIVNGTLSLDPVEPNIPANTVQIATILITPSTVTVSGGGKKGTGSVTSVTSTNTDIAVALSTTTPRLTLNKVNGVTISYYDPTSSIQTQLNSKLSSITGITAGGDLSGTYPNPTVTNAAVLGKVLTGLSISGSAVVSTDTIIVGFGKLQNQINTNTSNFSNYLPLTGGILSGFLTLNADPTNALHAATKNYVDNIIIGVIWVGADTDSTANITLSGEQTINGVTTSSSRVFVHGQTTQSENGIYISASGGWTRASDAATGAQIIKLAILIGGGSNKGQQWVNTNSSVTVGTTAITFSQSSGIGTYTNGTGILLTGTAFSLDAAYAKGLLSATSPIFYNATTGVISSQAATNVQNGYLTSADWVFFNNKVSTTVTINGKALSSNITLGLASADFANQGTTTTVLHGNAAGNPGWSQIVNADIANGTIDITAKVTGILPAANGGTSFSTYAAGDTLYASAINTLARLTIGSTGQIYMVSGGLPVWLTPVTQSPNDNSSNLATTAYVDAAIATQAKKTVIGSFQSII